MNISWQELNNFSLASSPRGALQPETGWIPAVVPGGVHESLLAAGIIDDPYHSENEESVRWIEERDWWYRAEFNVDSATDGELRIVFDGLDTVVDIFVDGDLAGHHENMFRPAEVDVTGLAAGAHELTLRFSPPLDGLEPPAAAVDALDRLAALTAAMAPDHDDMSGSDGEFMSRMLALTTLRRKATFSWGWDFAPRLPSIGIWRPVTVRRESGVALREHLVRLDAIDAAGRAHVSVQVATSDAPSDGNSSDDEYTVAVTLIAPSGHSYRLQLPVENGSASGSLIIDNPELWWTHDLGEPALHEVHLELRRGTQILDVGVDRVGLRTISIDRSPSAEGGRLFRFVLNGVPLFARGAAWLPPGMLMGSIAPRRIHDLVRLSRDGNMNMLRVWGGGIYEHDAFYDACDELGVLVWQDFMFACVDYPSGNDALAREVALEAEYQVRRLSNRACMAVWSGNNEVLLIHGLAYRNFEPGNWGYDFFFEMLPDIVARLGAGVPYWPGSPWGEDEDEGWLAVNGVRDGDRHAWEVWHGLSIGAGGGDFPSIGHARHYRRYAADHGRFISEFGIHSSPERSTLERWIPTNDLVLHGPVFDAHNKDLPKNKHDPILEIVTGLPTTVDEYVAATMVSQAEGLKFGIEHYRRRQPTCSGTLIWQLNDVWPGFSWSIIDHDLVPKAGYYAAKRAFAPILGSFKHDEDRLELWLTNSGRQAEVSVEVLVGSFSGETVIRERVTVALEAGASRVVWTADGVADPTRFAQVSGPIIPTNRLLFAEIKDVPFGPSQLTWHISEGAEARTAVITLHSAGYTFFAHALSPAPGTRFSDNYLDISDGGSATIYVEDLPIGFDVQQLQVRSYGGPQRSVD